VQQAFDFAIPRAFKLALTYEHRLGSFCWHVSLEGEAGAVLAHAEVPCGNLQPSEVLSALWRQTANELDVWTYGPLREAVEHLLSVAGAPF